MIKRVKYFLKHKHKTITITSIKERIILFKLERHLKRSEYDLLLWFRCFGIKNEKDFYKREMEFRSQGYHTFDDIDSRITHVSLLKIKIKQYRKLLKGLR